MKSLMCLVFFLLLVNGIFYSTSFAGNSTNCLKAARGALLTDHPQINKDIIKHMSDKKKFALEIDIAKFNEILKGINAKRTPKLKAWLEESQWELSLRNGQMPSLETFPKNNKISRDFVEAYFKSMLSPPRTYEDVFENVLAANRKSLDTILEAGEKAEKAHKAKVDADPEFYKGLTLVTPFELMNGPEMAKAVRIQDPVARKKAYAKFYQKQKEEIEKAYEVAKKIVQWDNLRIEMRRFESPVILNSEPVLHNFVSKPNENAIRKRLDDSTDFTDKAFSPSVFDLHKENNPRDMYPKSASFGFKKVPDGISVDPPYKEDGYKFLGGHYYAVDVDQVKDRAVYVGDDASNFWGSYQSIIDDKITRNSDEMNDVRNKLALSNHIRPMTDLSNLFEHVLNNLVSHPDRISMPYNTTIEVMIFGELKYVRDFNLQ